MDCTIKVASGEISANSKALTILSLGKEEFHCNFILK